MDAVDRRSSRALTLHAALERLGLLAPAADDDTLTIHLVGADTREGTSLSETSAIFAPLCAKLASTAWRQVSLLLVGPNCTSSTPAGGVTTPFEGGPRLLVEYSSLAYEDWVAARDLLSVGELQCGQVAHLAAAFNAGLWGYESWRPCVDLICVAGCPLLVTAYNKFEIQEDEETLVSWGVDATWHWHGETK